MKRNIRKALPVFMALFLFLDLNPAAITGGKSYTQAGYDDPAIYEEKLPTAPPMAERYDYYLPEVTPLPEESPMPAPQA